MLVEVLLCVLDVPPFVRIKHLILLSAGAACMMAHSPALGPLVAHPPTLPACCLPRLNRRFRRFCIAWNNRTKVECYSGECWRAPFVHASAMRLPAR